MHWFEPATDDQRIRAVPGEGRRVPIWILGSSTYGAQLAAHLGLPYAFASHFAPAEMSAALRIYRQTFRPSKQLAEPRVMLGFNAFVAETDDEARRLFSSLQQAFVNLRSGRPGKLPPPVEGYYDQLGAGERAMLDQALACSAVGAPATARAQLEAFVARTGADEVMVTGQIWDPAARIRSFELLAAAVA
jgi:luciferase family oxidoreductase group 1